MVCAVRGYPINITCQCCNNDFHVLLDKEDILEWISGHGYIQDVLYYLTENERELLISGICETCFDDLFNGLKNL